MGRHKYSIIIIIKKKTKNNSKTASNIDMTIHPQTVNINFYIRTRKETNDRQRSRNSNGRKYQLRRKSQLKPNWLALSYRPLTFPLTPHSPLTPPPTGTPSLPTLSSQSLPSRFVQICRLLKLAGPNQD